MKKNPSIEALLTADSLPAMIWVADPDGQLTYCNRSWLNFTGRTLPEELGNGWTQGIRTSERARCLEQYHAGIQSRLAFEMECRLRRADGQYRWVLNQAEPRVDESGTLVAYVGFAMDITEQKNSEESSARLAAVVQSSDDAIITKDLNGVINSWNMSAQRIFGYTEAEAIGRSITMLIPPELQPEEKEILRRLRAGERIDHFETVRIAKSGERVLISLTVSPVKNAAGKIVAASKVARDVTQTRKVEQALKESEERMRFCLEAAHVGTWHWDIRSGGIRWSENMECVHGIPPGSFRGDFEGSMEGIAAEDRESVRKAIDQALHGDGRFFVEYRSKRSDGKYGWLEAHGQVIYDASRQPAAMMGVTRDISESKAAQAALRDAHEQLEGRVKERTAELNRAQESLRALSTRLLRMQDDERRRLARELHDTVGQLVVALNLTLVPVEEKLKQDKSDLAKEVTAALGLIDELSRDLRTMSHLLHPPLLDEAGLHSAVRWYVEGFAERSKIAVDLQLDPSVGRLPSEFETAIFRIVQECLTNIHRHSGSRSARIVIDRTPDLIKLDIADQGKGMPSTARAGVGIQGMRERVRQLGGVLEIESGKSGTRIIATFPANDSKQNLRAEMMNAAS